MDEKARFQSAMESHLQEMRKICAFCAIRAGDDSLTDWERNEFAEAKRRQNSVIEVFERNIKGCEF